MLNESHIIHLNFKNTLDFFLKPKLSNNFIVFNWSKI
jgi:hypothetical protein